MKDPNTNSIDFDLVLLLAEGELDDNERFELFKQLDKSPGAWRKCALVLLETQMLRRQVKSMGAQFLGEGTLIESEVQPQSARLHSNEREISLDTAALNGVSSQNLENQLGIVSEPTNAIQNHALSNAKNTIRSRVNTLVLKILAAAILIAVGIGIGRLAGLNASPTELGTMAWTGKSVPERFSSRMDGISTPGPGISQAVYRTFENYSINDSQVLAVLKIQNQDREEFVPVMRSPTLETQWLSSAASPPSATTLNRLNRPGWNMIHERQFVALELPNQNSRIVPLDVISYEFAGNSDVY